VVSYFSYLELANEHNYFGITKTVLCWYLLLLKWPILTLTVLSTFYCQAQSHEVFLNAFLISCTIFSRSSSFCMINILVSDFQKIVNGSLWIVSVRCNIFCNQSLMSTGFNCMTIWTCNATQFDSLLSDLSPFLWYQSATFNTILQSAQLWRCFSRNFSLMESEKCCLSLYFPFLCFNFRVMAAIIVMMMTNIMNGAIPVSWWNSWRRASDSRHRQRVSRIGGFHLMSALYPLNYSMSRYIP